MAHRTAQSCLLLAACALCAACHDWDGLLDNAKGGDADAAADGGQGDDGGHGEGGGQGDGGGAGGPADAGPDAAIDACTGAACDAGSACDPGFAPGDDGCVDVDECAASDDPCGDHGDCENEPGGYACECDPGYADDGTSCANVDECADANGGCDAVCNDTEGGRDCACDPGGLLESDGTSCRTPAWSMPAVIDNAITEASWVQVGVNAAGTAVAVWVQIENVAADPIEGVFASVYDGNGWSLPDRLSATNNPGIGTRAPEVAVDPAGNAIAAWEQGVGGPDDVFASFMQAGLGFTAAVELDMNDTNGAHQPQVDVAQNGDALVAYYQAAGTISNVVANTRAASGGGWMPLGVIEMEADSVSGVRMALGEPGQAFVVWQQYDGANFDVFSGVLDTSNGTMDVAELDTTDEDANDPVLAANAEGAAVAVWSQWNGTFFEIWARDHVPGAGWGGAMRIDRGTRGASLPHVAMDADGNAMAAWSDFNGSVNTIFAARMAAGGGFGVSERIDQDGQASAAGVALDTGGNAVVVWEQGDAVRSIYANVYTAGTGWATAAPVEDAADNAHSADVEMDARGRAVAVWLQDMGGIDNAMASWLE